jgi:hypothetical protein
LSVVFIVMMPLPPRDCAVFLEIRAFADAVFAGDQQVWRPARQWPARRLRRPLFQIDAAHAAGGPAHRAGVFFVEPDAHAVARDDHHLALAGREFHVNQRVARINADGDDAAFADVGEIASAVFLTVPCLVAKKTKPGCSQVMSSLFGVGLGQHADERGDFSPAFNSSRLAMLRPLAARPMSGISCTRST